MFRRWGIGLCLLLAAGAATATRAAVGESRTPAPVAPARLENAFPEAPHVPDLDPSRCAACRMAAVTTGRVAPGSVQVHSVVRGNGIALHCRSRDPETVDLLWKASVARGELLAALRSGDPLELCTRCSVRRDLWFDLQVAATRLPDGVLLEYSATRPEIVRDLQRLVADPAFTAQF